MEEQPGLSDQYRMASPWPLLVAAGFALSEVGIFLGLFPVAVGGILLLGASVAGILRESGYVARPWRVLAGLGALFAVLGAAVVATQIVPATVSVTGIGSAVAGIFSDPSGIAGRGLAVVVGGVMLVAAGVTGSAARWSVP